MENAALIFLLVAAMWGWVVVIPVGALLIGSSLVRYFGAGRPWLGRCVWGISLLLFGIFWQQAMVQHNFGKTIGIVATQDGSREMKFRLSGSMTYSWKLETTPRPTSNHLNGRPKLAFWMRNDTSMGIEYHHGYREIVNVDLLVKANLDPSHLTSAEEHEFWNRHPLTPQEITEFDRELQRARQNGVLWTDE